MTQPCNCKALSSFPSIHIKTSNVLADTCSPSSGKAETVGSLPLLNEPIWAKRLALGPKERPCLKQQGGQLLRKDTKGRCLASTFIYIHVLTYPHIQVHLLTHINDDSKQP